MVPAQVGEFWGHGYGTEAAQAVLRYGIETCGFQTIRSVAYTENRASIRIMEKIGMRFERFGSTHHQQVAYYAWHAEVSSSRQPPNRCFGCLA